ncbi:hypothetical protein FRC04_003352 [Tulasnella sp. 424]|nr:hypothetical protein FRC04_003352 [Tulasnella sp. 424]KAG8977167.1 hypothetical protein FRC05_002166 [Tulasnella sp. 425]
MNYRIDLSDGDVRELIADAAQTRDYSPMIPFDQLKAQRDLGRCFTEFSEGPITFLPTYRFELGPTLGQIHDVKRRPAWTDRILYRSAESVSLKQLSYDCHPHIYLSDHKPVTSRFEIEARTFNLERMVTILEEIRTPLEGPMETDATPSLVIDSSHVDLGQVSCSVPLIRSIKLTNSSPAVAAFRFIPPSADDSITPPWLTVTPESGIILPGKSHDVELTVNPDYKTAGALNKGANIRDMLVIHVENGRDYFVSVAGNFRRTCLGNDLSWLASLSDPVRDIDPSTVNDNHGPSAPKEVMRLVSWLMSNAATEERLFLEPGSKDESLKALDTGTEFPESKSPTFTLSVGEALLELLKSLREPVVQWKYHALCATVTSRDQAFEVIERFPPASTNVLVSVTAFLHFSLQEPNKARAKSLARVFGSIFLWDNPLGKPSTWASPVAKTRFILYLIS